MLSSGVPLPTELGLLGLEAASKRTKSKGLMAGVRVHGQRLKQSHEFEMLNSWMIVTYKKTI